MCPRTAAAQAEIRGPAGTWQQDGRHCLRKTELPPLCGRPGAGGPGRESSQLEHWFVPNPTSSVPDPDPSDPLVRGMDLDPAPDPSVIKQK